MDSLIDYKSNYQQTSENLRDVCVIDDASIRDQRQVIKAAQDSIKPIESQMENSVQ